MLLYCAVQAAGDACVGAVRLQTVTVTYRSHLQFIFPIEFLVYNAIIYWLNNDLTHLIFQTITL